MTLWNTTSEINWLKKLGTHRDVKYKEAFWPQRLPLLRMYLDTMHHRKIWTKIEGECCTNIDEDLVRREVKRMIELEMYGKIR